MFMGPQHSLSVKKFYLLNVQMTFVHNSYVFTKRERLRILNE
jgi:hypothetical protein